MRRAILLLAVVVLVPCVMMMTEAAIGAATPDLKVAMRLTQPEVGLPSLLVLIPGTTATGRAFIGGGSLALLLAIAHLLTWRLPRK